MFIHHLAIWTKNLEQLKKFYISYFDCKANPKYRNESNNFESYFLSFEDGAQIELMQMPNIPDNLNDPLRQYKGIMHFAISVGDREKVIDLTKQLKNDGLKIVSEPRVTGDGYFESCVLDPEGNRIEIVA